MKIPNILKRISDNALIIAASRQDARLFRLKENELEEIDTIHVDTPRYSDHEEHFESRGQGGTIRAGSSIERPNVLAFQEFQKVLTEKLKAISRSENIAEIFICAPLNAKNAILNALPWPLKGKVSGFIASHLIKFPPLKILELLCRFMSHKNFVPIKPEADKILRVATT